MTLKQAFHRAAFVVAIMTAGAGADVVMHSCIDELHISAAGQVCAQRESQCSPDQFRALAREWREAVQHEGAGWLSILGAGVLSRVSRKPALT